MGSREMPVLEARWSVQAHARGFDVVVEHLYSNFPRLVHEGLDFHPERQRVGAASGFGLLGTGPAFGLEGRLCRKVDGDGGDQGGTDRQNPGNQSLVALDPRPVPHGVQNKLAVVAAQATATGPVVEVEGCPTSLRRSLWLELGFSVGLSFGITFSLSQVVYFG